ncbi:unnamed protein product [Aureobasidium vineae]|uniref:IBR domain-containing protein n=1 Tax=Aureobasidium vineae TaxID=2773715 RepID=A0A9N8JEV7_9PEZI|nr:unnamed protein product [Aureobasidium vineae]
MSAPETLKRSAEEAATPFEGHTKPRKKKRCRKPTCVVCDTKKYFNQFPSQAKVSSHDHGANVCRPCYTSHLEVEIDSKNWEDVACPECPVKLTYQEFENMAAPEDFAKCERASIRATLAADPDFKFCFSSTCDSGQLHPSGASEPIFSCQACRHKHCVVCETNWHEDQTCSEYRATLHRNTENDEKSQKEGNHRHETSCTHYRAPPSAEVLEVQSRRAEEARRRTEEAKQRQNELARRNREQREALQRAQRAALAAASAPRLPRLERPRRRDDDDDETAAAAMFEIPRGVDSSQIFAGRIVRPHPNPAMARALSQVQAEIQAQTPN